MPTLALQQPLIETLEQAAESQNSSIEVLLNQAVTEFLEKWVYFIKHADDLEVIPEHADDPRLQDAYTTAAWLEPR